MKKEEFEWIHSWCDFATKNDLPRILLIGDSIVNGMYPHVQTLLKGVCYVDYVATSYTIDRNIYKSLVASFVKNSKYDLVLFNYGLHGKSMSGDSYYKHVKKVVTNLMKYCDNVVLSESTMVNKPGNKVLEPVWSRKVNERNIILHKIGEELNLPVNPLFKTSMMVPNDGRFEDGVHYEESGKKILANQVVLFISEHINK